MESESLYISKNRNFYRKRRNFIRRLFFVFVIFSYVFFLFRIAAYVNSTSPQIEISQDKLINREFLLASVLAEENKKNFFLLSTKTISNNLLNSIKLLEDVVVRKYIFPRVMLCVLFKEKNVWARILDIKHKSNFSFVTNYGDIIPAALLNLANVPADLIDIYTYCAPNILSKDMLVSVNDLYKNLITYQELTVQSFTIDNKYNLDFDCKLDNTVLLRIKTGNINENLLDKIRDLNQIIKTIRAGQYKIEYVDLTLEKGAIIKTSKENQNN